MLLNFKKLGQHWYPDINHDNPQDLSLDPRLERILDHLDRFKDGQVDIDLIQQGIILIEEGLIQFTEDDIVRYLDTDDDFTMKLYISNHEYTITSKLYTLLEMNFNFNFHKETYRIEI